MSRKSVMLDIDSTKLREAIADRSTFSDLAQKYGVTRQAINNWLNDGKIPPRALVEIARDLDLLPEVIEQILAPSTEKHKNPKIVITIELKS